MSPRPMTIEGQMLYLSKWRRRQMCLSGWNDPSRERSNEIQFTLKLNVQPTLQT